MGLSLYFEAEKKTGDHNCAFFFAGGSLVMRPGDILPLICFSFCLVLLYVERDGCARLVLSGSEDEKAAGE